MQYSGQSSHYWSLIRCPALHPLFRLYRSGMPMTRLLLLPQMIPLKLLLTPILFLRKGLELSLISQNQKVYGLVPGWVEPILPLLWIGPPLSSRFLGSTLAVVILRRQIGVPPSMPWRTFFCLGGSALFPFREDRS